MMYVVSYTLRPKRDATRVLTALQQSPDWWHYLDDTWLIITHETAIQLYTRIAPSFQQTDSFLVVQVTPNADHQGWLPQAAWDWFNQRRYR
jgi:hypothetical protein